jgi:hypothetical protein
MRTIETSLTEETLASRDGHSRVTISVELGGDGAIRIAFQGREAPTVTYEYGEPADVLAIGRALVRAAQVAGAARGTETG